MTLYDYHNLKESFDTDKLLAILMDPSEGPPPYTELNYRRNEVIMEEGSSNRYFYVVRKGMVAMSKGTARDDSILTFCGPNDILGFLSVLENAVSPVAYTSISEVTLLQFERQYVIDKITFGQESFWYAYFFYLNFTHPILVRESLSNLPSDKKILAGLVIVAERFGRAEPDGSYLIPYYFTQKVIGKYLNLARAYVATNLRKLEQDGHISLSPKPWKIYDMAAAKGMLDMKYTDLYSLTKEN
ncbi:regulatory cyclic nucleotide-binding protein [Listeria grandensis FSL F6-0971]|uniref:Regulatory cyclic nucleotide-binding protein n=1 Tax=Listeria grandensis FSL F6-0971 TaxID=1265819 RepID=W7BBS9_9LIST|nr:Crp/Fnr family transcriptional regulator [Listeria grandensis]EUJ23487.1 regulatory cyclic nucleotide-binding protein [Listeria grandensis FSL F6-0971]